MRALTVCTVVALGLGLGTSQYAQTTGPGDPRLAPPSITSMEAVVKAAELDGKEVSFEGEAIGELMRRGDHAWLNVADSAGALGLWVDPNAIPAGLVTGSWKRRGAVVRAEGRFNRACAEHGGDLDIHASSISLIEPAANLEHPLAFWRLLAALGLLASAALLVPVWHSKIRRPASRHTAGQAAGEKEMPPRDREPAI
jgi:hypothetical protein